MRQRALRAAAVVLLAALASRAEAFPAFARKYGMSCTACHIAWPILNQVGQHFRDEGYQFGLGKDDPVALAPAYIPIALRSTAAYGFTRQTNQPSDQGPVTVQSGGVPIPPGADILTGGTIAKDVSFLLVVAGFGPDGLASAESAWVRLDHLGGSSWANVKVGKFELDQPASSHRGVTLTTGYAVYGAHPGGSAVGLDMSENQVGVELDGHDDRSLTRYALSFTSANGGEGQSGNGWSAPMLYGHVQQAFETGSAFLPWVRVGALGAVGWWPTAFDTTDSGGAVIAGTGRNHKQYTRAGAELSGILGNPATPLFFTAAWILGHEDAGLGAGDPTPQITDPASPATSFSGGFLELNWVPYSVPSENATPWLLFARYDAVRFKVGPGRSDGFTVGARRYLALGPRASAAIHVELHQDKVKGVGADDRDVTTQAVLAGIDFDF